MANSPPNLLRPGQVMALKEETDRLEYNLTQPHLQDRPATIRALRYTKNQLDTMVPTAFPEDQIDQAVKHVEELKTTMLEDGMPTRREMRANMPGAVGKLRRWERRNKEKLLAWKHLQLRINHDTDDPDVANFERYRPSGGAGELSVDNAQITPKEYYFGPNAGTPATIFDDAELEVLKAAAPATAELLPTLEGEDRQVLKALIKEIMAEKAPQPATPKAKAAPKAAKKRTRKPMTQAQKDAFRARMVAGKAAKAE